MQMVTIKPLSYFIDENITSVDGPDFVYEMRQYCGKTLEVEEEMLERNRVYMQGYWWDLSWLEGYKEHEQTWYRLKSTIKTRPRYFNGQGYMDWMLTGEPFVGTIRNNELRVVDRRHGGYEIWTVYLSDIEPFSFDNRQISAGAAT